MTAAVSVKQVATQQAKLQKAFEKQRTVFMAEKDKFMDAKLALCKFNDKYGRVIAMMEADKEE